MIKLPFPADVLNQHLVMLGKTGAGKSSALRAVVEWLLAPPRKKRVCVIDPKGDWWGVKVGQDGRSPGLPVVLFGDFKNESARDVPINERSGRHIAELVADGNRPCIIGMRGWTQGAMTRFWIDFASTLFGRNAGELFLVGDEFHNFAPKQWKGQAERDNPVGVGLHWANRLLSEGRGLGLVCLIASQRPQKVHNDTLTSCETLAAMRVVHAADRAAVKAWIDGCGDGEKGGEVLDSLASMPRGDAWVWSPEVGFGPKRVSFPMFETFDSFAPPQLQKRVSAKGWAGVDLDGVREALAEAVKEAEANDPKLLRQQVVHLRGELAKAQAAKKPAATVETKRVEVPVVKEADIKRIEKALDVVDSTYQRMAEAFNKSHDRLDDVREIKARLHQIAGVVANASKPMNYSHSPAVPVVHASKPHEKARTAGPLATAGRSAETRTRGAPGQEVGEFKIGKPQQKILESLAWWRSLDVRDPTVAQCAAIAGYAASGSFDTYLSRMGTAGLLERSGGRVRLLEAGEAMAPAIDAPTSMDELHRRILDTLDGPATRIITALIEHMRSHGTDGISIEDLAAASGYRPSGSFDTYLSRLGTRGFIERKRGMVQPTENLYPEALV